jgi:hypothetical protein
VTLNTGYIQSAVHGLDCIVSMSVRGMCTQDFQVLKLGKFPYCLSSLELETNLLIEIEKFWIKQLNRR